MRFLLHPTPDVHLALAAAAHYVGLRLVFPVVDLADLLGARWTAPNAAAGDERDYQQAFDARLFETASVGRSKAAAFTGPSAGSQVDADILARGAAAWFVEARLGRAGVHTSRVRAD